MDDNVVVDKATGRVHVIDFGTACRPGHDCGFSDSSNDYLAPEILGRGPSTAASDAFSVGAMLELISDQMARPCRTLGQLARELQRTDPRRRPALSAVPSSNTKGVEIRRSGLGCCLQSHRFRASSNGARRQEARDPCSRGRLSEVTPPQRRQGGTRRGREREGTAGPLGRRRRCAQAGPLRRTLRTLPGGVQVPEEGGRAGGSPRALGICSNPPAILCSFVGRSTLEKVLEESKCSDEELLRLSRSLCVAVQEVHGRGVIHNDLMDDNVVVDKATGRVHVIDFGTACRPGHDCGFSDSSNDYLAPEILGGGPSTAASDAFSVGAMLELISDQMARPCRTLGQLARELQRTDPRRRPALSAVIRRLDWTRLSARRRSAVVASEQDGLSRRREEAEGGSMAH
ncbi:serine/threonine protein kinase [Penaeus vannamei]|uniref:Serine/threonine protein kinase n=1 Tax=Penaeus vannamei TaxID=6689 RepID=A0A423SSC2_PENVA|nr:serine/threonine protein kinase [Penaeus vannamei]